MKGGRYLIISSFFLLALVGPARASDAEYEKGLAYLRAGRAEEAMKALSPLAAKRPGDPYLWYHIGLAEYRLERLDAAFEAFEKTAALAGASAKEFGLGPAFLNVGIGWFKARDFIKAEACLKKSLGFSPDDGDALYYLGLTRAEMNDFASAVGYLEKAKEKAAGDPKTLAAVRNAAGAVLYRQEKYGQALAEFSGALDADHDNIEALYYLSLVNYKENGYAAAKPYLDRLSAKGSYDEKTAEALFTGFFNIGVDFQNRDKPGPAAEMFEKAVRIRPGDADAHYYRGYNLSALDRYEEACDEFSRALAIDPAMDKAKAQLEVAGRFACESALKKAGEALARGQYPEAASLYEKAVKYDPANLEGRKGLKEAAAAWEKEKKRIASLKAGFIAGAAEAEKSDALGEAAALYEKALALDREDPKAAEGLKQARVRIADERARAKAALGEGRLAAAKKAYERLARYLPDDKEAAAGLEEVRRRMAAEAAEKAAEKAAVSAEKAQPQAVDDEEVRRLYLAGVEHYTKGELSEAINKWREVLRLDPGNEKAHGNIARAEEKLREGAGAAGNRGR